MVKIDNAPVIKKTPTTTELNEANELEKKMTKLEKKKLDKLTKEADKAKGKKKLTLEEKIDETILKIRAQWLTHIEVWAIKPMIIGLVK